MMLLTATPYDLGLPRLRYVSSHWWRESVRVVLPGVDDIRSRISWSLDNRPHWSGPTHAVLIDREGTDAETLVKVLEAFAELLPTCFRVVYDPHLRVVRPDQQPAVDAIISNRAADLHEQRVGQLAHAFAADCYLMGIADRGIGGFNVNHERSLVELPAQLDLTRAAAQAYESIVGKPVWPCVHERYHHGKGCGHNIWQPLAVWKDYNRIVGERWPGPRAWWSGSMRANPGNESDGWVLPAEADLRRYAEAVE